MTKAASLMKNRNREILTCSRWNVLAWKTNFFLSTLGLGKFHALLLLTSGLCLMSTIVETLNIGFVIPLIEMECELSLTLSQKGVLNSAAFVGQFCCQCRQFYLLTRIIFQALLSAHSSGGSSPTGDVEGDVKWCTVALQSLSSSPSSRHSLFTFGCSSSRDSSSDFCELCLYSFLMSNEQFLFSISGIAANTYAYLGEFHCESNRAKHLSFAGVFMALALTFCPGVAWLILKFEHVASLSFIIPIVEMNYSIWRIFLLACASLSGMVTILLCFLPESPKFLLAQGKHDEALKVLENIYQQNKKTRSAFPIPSIILNELLIKTTSVQPSFVRQVWDQTSPLFKSPLLSSTLRASFVMFSLFASSSGFFMWTPDILNKLLDYRGQNYTVCHVIEEVVKLKKMWARRHFVMADDGSFSFL